MGKLEDFFAMFDVDIFDHEPDIDLDENADIELLEALELETTSTTKDTSDNENPTINN